MTDEHRMNDGLDKPSPLDEQLVAYLDGELDVEGGRRIEAMLASDASVRRRLQEMQRTWDMLDDLDAAPVGNNFTQSTLEMVAVAAGEDVERSLADAPRRRRRRLFAISGGALAAVLVGFLVVRLVMPDANHQLLEDLPLLLNLDEYRQIDDIQFLRLLHDQSPFGTQKSDAPATTLLVQDESLAQRRQRVESMTDGDKEHLARLQERWATLKGDEREHIQALHDAILHSADAGQLLHVMHRYYEWLQTIPSYRWSDLTGLDPSARLSAVKKLEEERTRNETRS